METISLRPVEPERDFAAMAALFAREQDEPTTQDSLTADYQSTQARVLCLTAAVDPRGDLLGFNWLTRGKHDPAEANLYVIVQPDWRGQGAGARLYADLEQAARQTGITKLWANIRDDDPLSLAFAGRRGFRQKNHFIAMRLDLDGFDARPFLEHRDDLQAAGFVFTNMEALGNTAEAQRKLYLLNDTASSETPGSDGVHPWQSFEDFQQSVCQSNWYRPAGQMVVIDGSGGDIAGGDWAAMSAITRFEGTDYAYNLFTGVDSRYRGRKLAQAVKALALVFARETLDVHTVRTHHNALNAPMIAIDRKMGYYQTPGSYSLFKQLG